MKRFWLNWETGGANSNAGGAYINAGLGIGSVTTFHHGADQNTAVRDMRALRDFCDGIGWNIALEVLCAGGSEMDAIAKVEEEAAAMGMPSAKYWITRGA